MSSNDPDFKRLSGRFRIRSENSSQKLAASGITRSRDSHVCVQCRKSKLRCDRAHPCGNCLRRNGGSLCIYRRSDKLHQDAESTSSAESRLLHLETTVRELMRHHPVTPPDDILYVNSESAHVVDATASERERSGTSVGDSTYVGPTHWSSVLEDIQEIRLAVSSFATTAGNDANSQTSDLNHGQELIFGIAAKGETVSGIVTNYLPIRTQVDRYLSIYFSGETYIIPFIHTYHFQKEYEIFWQDPSKVSALWVSILFSICYMASVIGGASNSYRSEPKGCANGDLKLHEAAGKCLILGRYHSPQKHTVEALAMYGFCKNLRSLDPCREAGTIFGLVVRLAYQMGYHRDPDKFGSLSVFEGEMRRRCWAAVKQMDLMISFQLGLPSNIRMKNCDTCSPSNLLDSDFDFTTTVLPPSRPESEWSKILWFLVKDRQMFHFSKVWGIVLSFDDLCEADVLQIDQSIRQLHETTPHSLMSRPMSASIADSSFVILTRLYIDNIHQKTLCMLHRKYMIKGYTYSTKACVEAGKKIVSQFIDMHKEFSSGGQLDGERWMLTNFVINDFLLGVSVLCLYIHIRRKYDVSSEVTSTDSDMIQPLQALLEQAYQVCVGYLSTSNDASRVARGIRITLQEKVRHTTEKQAKSTALQHQETGTTSSLLETRESDFPTFNDTTQWEYPAEIGDTPWAIFDLFDFNGDNLEASDWPALESDMSF